MEVTLTGSEITVKYTEPTQNAPDDDGNISALLDLGKTSIFQSVNGVESKVKDVPATALTGGGTIEEKFVAPIVGKREADIQVWAIAEDTAGNPSDKSPVTTIRIDRLPPAPPF